MKGLKLVKERIAWRVTVNENVERKTTNGIESWKTQKPERSANQSQENEWVKNNNKQCWE